MLKEYREKTGMSQEDLERITDLDRKTIFRFEHDINTPLLDTFGKIAIALGLSDEEMGKVIRNYVNKKY